MEDIYLIGASGFAAEVTEYIKCAGGYSIAGYFDMDESGYRRYGYSAPFLGNEDNFQWVFGTNVLIAISDCSIRMKVHEKLLSKGCNFPNIIHETSFVSESSTILAGSVICPFVTVTSNAKIGMNFQANIYSYIAHDCVIGDNVTFAPAVKCNGNVLIEDNVYIGTGAIIFQGKADRPLVIGRGATIGAGAVVTKSVPAGMTVFGNPAIEFTKENIKRRS